MEDGNTWSILLNGLVTLFTTGGVLYLIVESIINRRKRHEEVKSQQVESVERAVGYGVPMVQLYEEIDRIVAKKTDPIIRSLDDAREEIKQLRENYCCYRDSCEMRIRNEKDARNVSKLDHDKFLEHYGGTEGDA